MLGENKSFCLCKRNGGTFHWKRVSKYRRWNKTKCELGFHPQTATKPLAGLRDSSPFLALFHHLLPPPAHFGWATSTQVTPASTFMWIYENHGNRRISPVNQVFHLPFSARIFLAACEGNCEMCAWVLRQERLVKRPGLLLAKIPRVLILYREREKREKGLIHDFWVLN